MADKKWSRFKTIFAEEYHDLVEDTKVTIGDSGFHLDNKIQEIGGALEQLAMAAGAYKNIVTKLTEGVEKLKKNNKSLTMQLRDAMKINLEMARKLIVKDA